MVRFESFVESCGFQYREIPSEGMEALVIRKKGFPANRPKFCTYELKILPAKKWMDQIDPGTEAICMVGVRREESVARRTWPETIESSENHGGRTLWSPLVNVREEGRNNLLRIAGFEPLPHRSRECSPCVNSNRSDFRMLPQQDIDKVRAMETSMCKTMFRKQRFHGAEGIDEVLRWAWSERGKYEAPEEHGCDSGMCGD